VQITPPNFIHMMCREAGVRICVHIFEAHPLKFVELKTSKFAAISDDFRLRSRISPNWQSENDVINYSLSHVWRKKIGELWST